MIYLKIIKNKSIDQYCGKNTKYLQTEKESSRYNRDKLSRCLINFLVNNIYTYICVYIYICIYFLTRIESFRGEPNCLANFVIEEGKEN